MKCEKNADKLQVINPNALIDPAHACRGCGAHMQGPVERRTPFNGAGSSSTPSFERGLGAASRSRAFVSSIIESGTKPEQMAAIRAQLTTWACSPYDCLSPALMDYIATYTAKASGVLKD